MGDELAERVRDPLEQRVEGLLGEHLVKHVREPTVRVEERQCLPGVAVAVAARDRAREARPEEVTDAVIALCGSSARWHRALRFPLLLPIGRKCPPPTANLIAMKCSAFLALVVVGARAGRLGRRRRERLVRRGREAGVRQRDGTTLQKAVQQLLAGPTAAERSRGIRSAVPRATPLRSITVTHRVVTVDLGARFAAGSDQRLLQAARRPARPHPARRPGRARSAGARRRRRAHRPVPRLRPQQAGGGTRSSRPSSTSHPRATSSSV